MLEETVKCKIQFNWVAIAISKTSDMFVKCKIYQRVWYKLTKHTIQSCYSRAVAYKAMPQLLKTVLCTAQISVA